MSSEKKYALCIIGQITLDDAVLNDSPVKQDCPGGDGPYSLGGAFMWKPGKMGFTVRRGYDFDLTKISNFTGDLVNFDGVVEVPDVPNIHIWNMYDRKGNRYFINQYWSGTDEFMAPRPEDIPGEYITDSKAVHIAAMPIEYEQELIKAMPLNGESDLIVQVDPHFEGVYHNEHYDLWMDELLKHVTIFQPSELELTKLFRINYLDDIKDYIPYLKKVAEHGPKISNVKLGDRGCLTYNRETDECYHVPVYGNKVVDVTGCGDTFCGGYIASFIENRDIFTSAIRGTISSSFNLEHYGCLENYLIPKEAVVARYREFESRLSREKCRVL